jgi:alkaline phosphatase D
VYYDRDYDEWTSLRLMQDRWAKQRSLTNLQPLLSSTSHAAIWDDHDYGPNDSDKTYTLRRPSLELFQSYWPNAEYPNPEDGVYHRLSLQHTDVFMLDTRFNREPNNLVKPNKELLGREQWQWLKSELLASRATFKIIVSSMQVLAEYHDYECWEIFPEQRQQLFDFLKDNEIEGVVLLSGDRHIGEVIVKQHLLSYPVTEFTASPLAAGVGGGVPDAQVPDRVPGSLVTAEHFGILDFDFNSDDPSLIYSARDVNGEVLGARIEIRASQLKCRQ